MSDTIPFLDLPRQHETLAPALRELFERHVRDAAFVGGAAVSEFEAAFAKLCQTQGCVGVANGTDALMLALRALGVGTGDVVVVPAHTFIATAEAATMLGARVRFADVDPTTYTLSAQALEKMDSSGVKAVVPVHLYGQPADLDEILAISRKRGWKVVEDCAQAHGARYRGKSVGSFAHAGGFSFYPGKNLGALGDGGAVVSSDPDLLARVRSIANHGRGSHVEHVEPGVNSRLDAIQAAVLSLKLAPLGAWTEARARVAQWYDERLAGVRGLTAPRVGEGRTHVYHLYVVLVPERDTLRETLAAQGIQSGLHYARPLHLQPAYQGLGYSRGAFPHAERIADSCVSLPMFPELTLAQVERISQAVVAHVKAGA
jgi:dTDP-4-amino-4,6-dideoxygalactose transaminase